MKAIDTLAKILETSLYEANLKYCLVNDKKLPFQTNDLPAKSNDLTTFIDFDELLKANLDKYAGIGISIQASNICAIDVDKCFAIPFDVNSGNDLVKEIINLFKDLAYIEFSFSGKGLRVLFRQSLIENYSKTYFIKNEKYGIEYYQPSQSYRYVTVTGNVLFDNKIDSEIDFSNILIDFLNKYMKRPIKEYKKQIKIVDENESIEELMKKIKTHYLTNHYFQEIWFSQAPGSGKDESERDFYLLSYIYENITRNKEKVKLLFESSPFFNSKDFKHKSKWEYSDFRYFEYVYERITE